MTTSSFVANSRGRFRAPRTCEHHTAGCALGLAPGKIIWVIPFAATPFSFTRMNFAPLSLAGPRPA
jgi:hypothetical protein